MESYVIHKPTHRFISDDRESVIAIGQKRGDSLYLNLIGRNGELTQKTWAVGSCANHLTGYGKGVCINDSRSIESMIRAWRFTFGSDVKPPVSCERLK